MAPGGGNAVGGEARPLDAVAGELRLGEPVEVLLHARSGDGWRRVTRRRWTRDAAATLRAVGELAGDHEHVPWRWSQVLARHGARWVGLRVVNDWRDDTALLCEVEGPTPARVRRELGLLAERYGPHRRRPVTRTLSLALIWAAAGGAAWLSAMRELQSTPVAHAVAVAMWWALAGGLAMLGIHLVVRAVPPRRLWLQPDRVRAAVGWSWIAVATVFVLRPPWEPYVEWFGGWLLAFVLAVAAALASVPRHRSAPSPEPRPSGAGPVPAGALPVQPALPPTAVHESPDAVAAYWRTRTRLQPAGSRWNVVEHSWEAPAGTVTAESYDTWDDGPVHVVLARTADRTLLVRSRRDPLPLARDLTDSWFGAGEPVVHAPDTGRDGTGWAVPVVLAWLCLLTFVVGSDLGPSTYEWFWPQDLQVDHDYPLLAGACIAGVALAWLWAAIGVGRLVRSPGRDRRRQARTLAWQLVAAWVCAEVLTLTVAPRLAGSAGGVTVTAGVAVANLVALAVALAVVRVIRPDSPLGGVIDRHA